MHHSYPVIIVIHLRSVCFYVIGKKKTDSYSNAMNKKLETAWRDCWDENGADTALVKCLQYIIIIYNNYVRAPNVLTRKMRKLRRGHSHKIIICTIKTLQITRKYASHVLVQSYYIAENGII